MAADRARDLLTGTLLFVIALVWIGFILTTIPDSPGSPSSARTFPLASGIALAVLSAVLLAGAIFRTSPLQAKKAAPALDALDWRGIAATFGFLAVYILLLKLTGFLIGTVVALAAFLYLMLGKRSPWLLIGYPVGFAVAVWLILGKLLAVYLPQGELINLF
ncbi:tripartite tricarboxylate transporter TctB family protein [Rhodoplanes sp. TEM]|uniref:Tripartite tricarboxylate transporter TctB family protein n=1 Tax=Rhodoplanes tepidamans TaxID=200616 RepID=A0ABT5J945_RHOTP|nr:MULTISPECIES: tripartite tricarboxylate transporter TctB family protein [Rhodoplanes]MDC7786132.1 tripartite tricarboxylate transporter TctB family protein [Rhodoplanes tepidamans]MDC7982799.1 tripartite tricarboxylate transporter TctB family protein [Rhodoplanes sp. TEM]MDQ0357203.1 cytochrome b561 [Rhodoplanes tepidamans]